jgi:hypothetical protein
MAWIRTALASAILLASLVPIAAQEEDGPVPPVYVPEEQQDNVPSGPPAVCQGRNCLPPEENPVQQCEGRDCTPEPLEESE